MTKLLWHKCFVKYEIRSCHNKKKSKVIINLSSMTYISVFVFIFNLKGLGIIRSSRFKHLKHKVFVITK